MKSIISDDVENICYLCGRMGRMQVHHIFGGPVRNTSDKHGLIVHLCLECHDRLHGKNGEEIKQYLHRLGQKVYEEQIGSRDRFIEEFIRSYL